MEVKLNFVACSLQGAKICKFDSRNLLLNDFEKLSGQLSLRFLRISIMLLKWNAIEIRKIYPISFII